MTVVGCAGSYPSADSAASCYLFEAPYEGGTYRLVVDLGNGALTPLQQLVDLRDVDAIVISHLHPDHYMDICGTYVYRKYHPEGPLARIPLWGPAGCADRFADAYDLPHDPGMHEEFAIHEWADHEIVTLGPFTILPRELVHPVEAYGLRISDGSGTVAYSGDTGPTQALVELAAGADLFLCEASFVDRPNNPPELHLTGSDAGEAAAAAEVGRLLLTHVPSWTDHDAVAAEAKATFDGPSELVEPGGVYVL
ncbi:MBL fold metallo-hydrolase [Mumia flava]|nr:MBL fold metallo-hydrolase [Mumia flava]